MTEDRAFTPQRLVLARRRRRMTLEMLARKVKISAQSITAFENGRTTPSPRSVNALADALLLPTSFFTAGPLALIEPAAITFRARTKTSARLLRSAAAAATFAAVFNTWLEARLHLPRPDVPHYGDRTPQQAAQQLRADWFLHDSPIGNMVELLEQHGVRVFTAPGDCLRVQGPFSTTHQARPLMFLNSLRPTAQTRWDAAHELGHLVMHAPDAETGAGSGQRDRELEADRFAAAFLIPRNGVLGQLLQSASTDRIRTAARTWGVTPKALTYRLHDLDLLADWQFRTTTLRELAQDDPDPQPQEPSTLMIKTFANLHTRGVTPSDVATAIHLHLGELNTFMLGLDLMDQRPNPETRPADNTT
jgi:Zn-dependent peptidase ImmA (M78 family)/transcriptional regulator with XRE-family HTH domain